MAEVVGRGIEQKIKEKGLLDTDHSVVIVGQRGWRRWSRVQGVNGDG